MTQIEAAKTTESLAVAPTDDLQIVRSQSTYERRFKRPVDAVGGLLILVVASPVIIGIALAIRARLGQGVLYSQERVGAGEQPFTIYKFRTMQPDRRERQIEIDEVADRRAQHKHDNDPRHTRLGRLLRRFSLDELPQLINVVRGEMSLVGPRPEVVAVAEKRGYLHHPRHQVKPGMTGPFQVSDLRLSGDLRDGLELDTEYTRSITFGSDLAYLFKTVSVMLWGASGS